MPATVSLVPEIRRTPAFGGVLTPVSAGMRPIDEILTESFQPTSLAGID